MSDHKSTGPAIILVHPQMGENIGMCARAMLNCGLTDLRLVAPRDGWPNEAARATSSGALAVVDNARVYDTLDEAVADCTFVVATTARLRDIVKPVLTPATASDAIIKADAAAGKPVSAIMFGPERAGLENDHLVHADALMTIPLNPDYSSLNIAQAVLLVAYEWYQRVTIADGLRTAAQDVLDQLAITDAEIASKNEVDTLMAHLTDALDESGFFTAQHLRPTVLRNLMNTFQRMRLSTQETHTFHGIIKSLRGKEWKRAKN